MKNLGEGASVQKCAEPLFSVRDTRGKRDRIRLAPFDTLICAEKREVMYKNHKKGEN